MKQQITKNAIETAFLKLLKDRNFEKVMVKDIVEECGLTRNTFYYYYEDTYNIIEDILEREARGVIERMEQGDSILEAVDDLFEFLEENPKVAYHLFCSAKKDDMYRYVRSMVEIIVRYHIEHSESASGFPEKSRKIIINSSKYVVQGMIAEWLEGGRKTSLSEELQNAKEVLILCMKNDFWGK